MPIVIFRSPSAGWRIRAIEDQRTLILDSFGEQMQIDLNRANWKNYCETAAAVLGAFHATAWRSIQLQRLADYRIPHQATALDLPTIWLKSLSFPPSSKDATAELEALNTNIREWDADDERNLGVRLVDGHIEFKIKSPDEVWIECLFKAFRFLNVDARAAYGLDLHPASSILIKIDDPLSVDRWATLWPHGWRDKSGQWIETSFVASTLATQGDFADLARQFAPARLDPQRTSHRLAAKPEAQSRTGRARGRGSRSA